jgi:hypothetical protein
MIEIREYWTSLCSLSIKDDQGKMPWQYLSADALVRLENGIFLVHHLAAHSLIFFSKKCESCFITSPKAFMHVTNEACYPSTMPL